VVKILDPFTGIFGSGKQEVISKWRKLRTYDPAYLNSLTDVKITIPGRDKSFFFLHSVHTESGTDPASYLNGRLGWFL
jgi:hypothetical protein